LRQAGGINVVVDLIARGNAVHCLADAGAKGIVHPGDEDLSPGGPGRRTR
jgi:hypothetical protein